MISSKQHTQKIKQKQTKRRLNRLDTDDAHTSPVRKKRTNFKTKRKKKTLAIQKRRERKRSRCVNSVITLSERYRYYYRRIGIYRP